MRETNQADELDQLIDRVLQTELAESNIGVAVDQETAQTVTDLLSLAESTPLRPSFVDDLGRDLSMHGEKRVARSRGSGVNTRPVEDEVLTPCQAEDQLTMAQVLKSPTSQFDHRGGTAAWRILSITRRFPVQVRALTAALSVILVVLLLGAGSIATAAPIGQSVATAITEIQGRIRIVGKSSPWSIRLESPLPTASTPTGTPSLDQIALKLGFRPLAPSSLPPGYHLSSIQAAVVGSPSCCFRRADGSEVPGSIQTFDGPEGMLMVLQIETGDGNFDWTAANGSYQPEKIRGQSGWFIDGYWERQGSGLVWKTGEQGAFRQIIWSDGRFTYTIRGHLDRASLLRIAGGLR